MTDGSCSENGIEAIVLNGLDRVAISASFWAATSGSAKVLGSTNFMGSAANPMACARRDQTGDISRASFSRAAFSSKIMV
jgi:hypothetical protein